MSETAIKPQSRVSHAPAFASLLPEQTPTTRFNKSRLNGGMLIGGFAVLLAVVPGMYGMGWMDITTVNQLGRFLTLAIVALGIDMVWGYTGILSLCQAMFFCFGGYAMGMHLALHGPLDARGVPQALSVVSSTVGGIDLPWFWKPFQGLTLAVILGVLLTGAFAFVFGFFAFRSRVRGVYFSIITQATTLAATQVFRKNEMLLCGTNGLTNFVTLAGFELQKPAVKLGLYVISAVTLLGAFLLCRGVVKSRAGRLLMAVRDNESRLRFAGYQPVTFKVFVFVLGAILAAVGGMLYTPQNGIITPYKMDPVESIFMVVFVAVGGRGTLTGAMLGALIVNYMQSYLTSHAPMAWPFVMGGLFVAVTLFIPDGIVGAWRKLLERINTVNVTPAGPGRVAALIAEPHTPLSLEDEYNVDHCIVFMQDVVVEFDGFRALDVKEFGIKYNELRVVVGPNGAGKTTLCDVISGKTRVKSGHVFFDKAETTHMPDTEISRRGVGRKFQTPTVFDSLTVYENMELALPGRRGLWRNAIGKETRAQRERIMELLERVQLADESHRAARYLSHGQRQWLEISMLIVADPKLLLVDEPAAGLTDEETALTAELLLELKGRHTIMVIEHDMEFVRRLDSRVTVLDNGKVLADGTLDEVQKNEAVIEAYLGR